IRGEGAIEMHAARLEKTSGSMRFLNALLGKIGVLPACEEVLAIPFALAVPHKDEKTGHKSSFDWYETCGAARFRITGEAFGLILPSPAHRSWNKGPACALSPTAQRAMRHAQKSHGPPHD